MWYRETFAPAVKHWLFYWPLVVPSSSKEIPLKSLKEEFERLTGEKKNSFHNKDGGIAA